MTSNQNFQNDNCAKENTEIISNYLKSTSTQKMWNYFLDISKKEYFIDTIKQFRKKYGIPEKGYNIDEEGRRCIPPRGSVLENDHKKERELRNEAVNKLCKKYKLHYFDYSDVILFYIYYNELSPLYELGACGLFRICDVIDEKEEPFDE